MENTLTETQRKVVNIIIEWATFAKSSKRTEYADEGTTFTIPLKAFNLVQDYRMFIFLKDFFDQLVQQKCFERWNGNPYKRAGAEEFIFTKVDLDWLKCLVNPDAYLKVIRKEIKVRIKKAKTYIKLGDIESKVLKHLTDAKPHSTKDLKDKSGSKSIYKIKATLNTKLKKYGLYIIVYRKKNKPSLYQLQLTPIQN